MPVPSEREIKEYKDQLEIAQKMLVHNLRATVEDGEIYTIAAKGYRKLFDCLKEQGFTSEEALSIVRNYNPIMAR